jgi:hypothetical protein
MENCPDRGSESTAGIPEFGSISRNCRQSDSLQNVKPAGNENSQQRHLCERREM